MRRRFAGISQVFFGSKRGAFRLARGPVSHVGVCREPWVPLVRLANRCRGMRHVATSRPRGGVVGYLSVRSRNLERRRQKSINRGGARIRDKLCTALQRFALSCSSWTGFGVMLNNDRGGRCPVIKTADVRMNRRE
jgi:hypothetical protein